MEISTAILAYINSQFHQIIRSRTLKCLSKSQTQFWSKYLKISLNFTENFINICHFFRKFNLRKSPKWAEKMNQVFININLSTLYDSKRKKIRVRPTSGQNVPVLWVSCSKKQRNQMIVGTVFKTDVKLIESDKRKPYLKATKKILGQLSLF